jgi:serine/threonine-protein kinase
VTDSLNPTRTEDTLDGAERDALAEPALVEASTTLTGLGPVELAPTDLDSDPGSLDALADTLSIRSRKTPEPLPPRATRDYHPPTFLVPPPGSASPEEPMALRSVWIEPEVTEVKQRSALSEYAPAVDRARRAAAARNAVRAESRSGQSDAPWSTNPIGEAPHPTRGNLRTPLLAFVASVVATVALLFVLVPKSGRMLVTAAGPGNASIAIVEVLVDGRRVCSSVPCRVEGLSRGSHLVRVQARGYVPTADQAVAVHAGEDAVVHLSLAPRNSGRIDVRADAAHALRVTLDGIDRGVAPLVLGELSAGTHALRLAGNLRYAPFEQQIALEAEQSVVVEPKLVPLKAVINVTAGRASLGARVEITGGGARHEIREFPARVEVSPDATYALRAHRIGYLDYQTEVSFADGALQKDVVIDLAWDVASGMKPEALPASSLDAPATSGGSGMLAANSIPISNVFVDGQAMGATPVRTPLSPGQHSVVFVHPSLGKKSVSVNVSPGKPAVAAVRF